MNTREATFHVEALPTRVRVLDRLASVMFEAGAVLDILLEDERADDLRWIERHVQNVVDEVNDVIEALCDQMLNWLFVTSSI